MIAKKIRKISNHLSLFLKRVKRKCPCREHEEVNQEILRQLKEIRRGTKNSKSFY